MAQLCVSPGGICARPRGKPNIFTVDLEDWYHGLEIPPSAWSGFGDRIERSSERLLRLLEEYGVRATFFALGAVVERHPELVERISEAGHEIATHGFSHRFVYRQSRAEFAKELRRSIDLLEGIAGKEVLGHRAAFFSVRADSLWALEEIADAGLKYDSSIFPVANYRYGIPSAPREPFRMTCGNSELWELPLATTRILGWNVPCAGGAYFRLYPYALTRAACRRLNRSGRPFVFYIHPWELDPAQPRIELPKRISFTHYYALHKTEERLRRLLEEFQFGSVQEYLGSCDFRPGSASRLSWDEPSERTIPASVR